MTDTALANVVVQLAETAEKLADLERLVKHLGADIRQQAERTARLQVLEEAMATLTLADQILASIDSERTEERLTFLALAQHRLGEPEEARATLGRLRVLTKQPGWFRRETVQVSSREIEALEQDIAFPADPFAP